jgi:hypothetical protein
MKTAVTVTEEEARGIALVRALEEHGGAVPMLDATQRAAAGNVVWKSIGPTAAGLSDADWVQRFLLPRTQRLLDEAASAQPVVRRLETRRCCGWWRWRRSAWPRWAPSRPTAWPSRTTST